MFRDGVHAETLLTDRKVEVLVELERVLADPAFQVSERHRKFLRYIVVETVEGRSEAIKAYSIAVDVFGRPTTFDSSVDPVVRIEATRLRAALTNYYKASPSPVEIEIPRGGYVPRLRKHEAEPEMVVSTASENPELKAVETAAPASVSAARTTSHFRSRAAFAMAGTLSLAAILSYGLWAYRPAPMVFTERPLVYVDTDKGIGSKLELSNELRDRLAVALARFSTVRVGDPDTHLTPSNAPADPEVISVSRDYRVVLSVSQYGDRPEVAWRVLNEAGELIRTGKQDAPVDQTAGMDALVSILARDIAGYPGAIPSVETRLELDNPTFGNGCVQRAFVALGERLDEEIARARACLEQTVLVHPGDADARAMLSMLIITARPFATGQEEIANAVELARTAVGLAPDSQRSAFALMVALYHAREVPAAIAAGRRAVALNPHEPGARFYLGWILFASGRWEEGVSLVNDPRDRMSVFSNFDAGSTLALDAYRRGQYETALTFLNQKPYRRPYLASLILIATLGQLDRRSDAGAVIETLEQAQPGFATSFSREMSARSLAPELVTALRGGLEKAGLRLQ